MSTGRISPGACRRSIVTLGLAASLLAALDRGGAILGATSSRLRRLGPGGTLELGQPNAPARRVVRVTGVLPDRDVGGHELLVSRRQAAALGQRTDRYLLVEPAQATPWPALAARIRALLRPGARLRIRGPRAGGLAAAGRRGAAAGAGEGAAGRVRGQADARARWLDHHRPRLPGAAHRHRAGADPGAGHLQPRGHRAVARR
jgi:hypothetical protein